MSGLILREDYNDVGICECCESENVGRKKFDAQPMLKKPERMLCFLCADTFVSSYHLSSAYYDIFPVVQIVAQVGNIILKRIAGVPMDADELKEKQ